MKRWMYAVTVAALLTFAWAGPAAAGIGVPEVDSVTEDAAQTASFGDQTVGEQRNDADVTQTQGNGNVNVSPAVAIFGDAETTNEQGNDNVAKAEVEQENDVDQTQSSTQKQSLEQSGSGCCSDGQSQTAEQKVYGGDQTVGEQRNDADVTQKQGNGNVNVSPAVAIFGDAETKNEQGNDNYASAEIEQENDVDQSQSAYQEQHATQTGGRCCEPRPDHGKKGYEHKGGDCCDGQSQTGEQKTSFGDQTVEKQKNDADVTQWQGNGNVNVSPAVALFGNAETWNRQGSDNTAKAEVEQENDVDQTQSSRQHQDLSQDGDGCCKPEHGRGYPKRDDGKCASSKHGDSCTRDGKQSTCCDGRSETAEQKVYGGDQTVGEQRNDADVTQKQGNGNVNVSPAVAVGGKHGEYDSCRSKCGNRLYGKDGASTWNEQGNGNRAYAYVDQENDVEQSQRSYQRQSLVQRCKEVIFR